MEGGKGEATMLLEEIKTLSQDIFDVLMEIDNRIADIENESKLKEEIDRNSLLEKLGAIRQKIGAIEREDTREIDDEKILQNLFRKLDSLIDQVIDS